MPNGHWEKLSGVARFVDVVISVTRRWQLVKTCTNHTKHRPIETPRPAAPTNPADHSGHELRTLGTNNSVISRGARTTGFRNTQAKTARIAARTNGVKERPSRTLARAPWLPRSKTRVVIATSRAAATALQPANSPVAARPKTITQFPSASDSEVENGPLAQTQATSKRATVTRIVAEATKAGRVASVKMGDHHGEIASDKKVKIPKVNS